jgi:DNA-binding LacI/PurR family transcriptional regulator
MSEAKLQFVDSDKSSLETTHDLLIKWQDEGTMPTAILCAADVHALSFLIAAEKQGVDVPGQLSVIGADNVMLCEHSRPQLTSINQPFEEMGVLAASKLIEMIHSPSDSTPALLDVSLIKRESCARVAKL